jgi:hypothetical protein
MIVDTTSRADNLHVEFAPGGYFLRTNTGRNIRMQPNADGTIWTCEEMWHITDAYAALTIKATMFTGTEFSDDDEGADIPGWSQMVVGTSVPLASGGGNVTGGMNGWARIHIDNTDPNGHMEFVLADGTKCLPAALEISGGNVCYVTVMEGKYHQVKRMLAARGKPVVKLRRIAVGELEIGTDLGPGGFRELDENDLCKVLSGFHIGK